MTNMFGGIDLDEKTDDPVENMARVLMAAWKHAEPGSVVTQYPGSYIATFVDMARAAVKLTEEEIKRLAQKLDTRTEMYEQIRDTGRVWGQ